ncbi:MAG: hypothetical protein ABI162_05750 [Luteolibacter sp.]
MNNRDIRRLTRAQNVLIFSQNNAADHGAIPAVAEHLGKIAASVTRVTGARADQIPNRITKSSLLDALLLDFKRIASTARAIELRDDELGFAVAFNNVPARIEKDIRPHADSLLKLLEDNDASTADGGDIPAQKTAKAALRARFLALAINPAFVTNLRRDRDALDEAHAHNRTEVQEGTENTALIDEQLTLINTEVDILDPIMTNLYEHQPEKLHAWQRASRVERDPQRAKRVGGDTPPAPAP